MYMAMTSGRSNLEVIWKLGKYVRIEMLHGQQGWYTVNINAVCIDKISLLVAVISSKPVIVR